MKDREDNSSKKAISNDDLVDDINIDSLLNERPRSSDDDSLESIFKRRVNNPFSSASDVSEATLQERKLEEMAKADDARIHTTGYSIHILTPYILVLCFFCSGFIIIDSYFFNIIEFLSEDIRYKLPAYGVIALLCFFYIYFFIKKCIEYSSFVMELTKYNIVQGSRRTTVKTRIPYYTVQEFVNERGIIGRILNYGKLSLYLSTRRSIVFENLHGVQYVYDIIEQLKSGNILGLEDRNKFIASLDNKENDLMEEIETLNYDVDISDLGFTTDELKEIGMDSKDNNREKKDRNRRRSSSRRR